MHSELKSKLSYLYKYIDVNSISSKEEIIDDICSRIKNGAYISYAQNYEDVLLNRIFISQKKGTYVDVGAYHPFNKSVTCLFSTRGWTGVNIDLCDENIDRFNIHRPNDLNLCIAIGSKNHKETFYIQEGTTRSTKDKKLAESYKNRGLNIISKKYEVHTLTDILIVNNIEKIDFLTVDVEGSEAEVFSGLDFGKYKPTVILAEATYPETNRPCWDTWEYILLDAGYDFVYFDGLNRFYVQKDDQDLKKYFVTPPNYFDNFIRYESIINLLSE